MSAPAVLPRRKVRFVRVTLENLPANECVVEVEFRQARKSVKARTVGVCGPHTGMRYAAQATAQALGELGHDVRLELVESQDVLGTESVVTRVEARRNGDARQLMGFCVSGHDPLRASALAILNATNRFLGIG